MDMPSGLRWAGLAASLIGFALLMARRRERLLGRWELIALVGTLALAAIAVFPTAADLFPYLTGFTGELSRITSLLVFAVLALGLWTLSLQAQLAETRFKFMQYLRITAVDRAIDGGDAPKNPDVALVMPAYNEAENLRLLLEAAPSEVDGLSVAIIVVDDGSRDGTAETASALGAWVVRNPVNAGGGHALHVGFLAAQRIGARFVVTMDADGQHRFEDLPNLLQPLREDGVDVVVGSRRLGQSIRHQAVRALGLRVFNLVISFLVGRRVTDCSSGYRAFSMARFEELNLVQLRHHTAEMIIEAARRGLTIAEVPITILERQHGESKKGANWLYGFRFANTILSSWWRR